MTFSQRTAPKAFPRGRRVFALILIFFFLFLLQDCISLLRGHCSSTAGRLSIFSLKQKILDELTVIKLHWLTLNAKCRSSFHFHKASYILDFFLLKELYPYLMDM